MITFKSVEHALATFWKNTLTALPKIEKAIEGVEAKKTEIEAVSAVVASAVAPGSASMVISVEDALCSLLGAVDSALKSGGAAAEQKLIDAGLDQAAINAVKSVGVQSKAVYTLVSGK